VRTKKHYEDMLALNPTTAIGFALAADMVYAARHDIINRSEAHSGAEWRNIARTLKQKYGESLTVSEVRQETAPIKTAAATLGRKGGSVKSEKKAASSRENGKRGGRPKTKAEKI
jgi:hypothetical protein